MVKIPVVKMPSGKNASGKNAICKNGTASKVTLLIIKTSRNFQGSHDINHKMENSVCKIQ